MTAENVVNAENISHFHAASADQFATLRKILAPAEISLLLRIVGQGETLSAIALTENVTREAIGHRARRARVRLQAAGIVLTLPGRGRPRRSVGPGARLDPETLDRLVATGSETLGRPAFRWADARYPSRSS